MVTDPVNDLLTSIRNIALTRKSEIVVPYSKLKEAVAAVLVEEGYLAEAKKLQNTLTMTLAMKRRHPVITSIKGVSRPGLRVYKGVHELPRPLGGSGISIISTPLGVMSNKLAKKKGVGGEVLAEIF